MKQGKYLLTSLLIAACILATVLFFTIAPTTTYTLSDLEDLRKQETIMREKNEQLERKVPMLENEIKD